MIGRLVEFEGSQQALKELEHILVVECVDKLRSLPGLSALHVMVDREVGKAVTLAVWEDAESAEGALEAMVPLRRIIVTGGLRQHMHDYEVVA